MFLSKIPLPPTPLGMQLLCERVISLPLPSALFLPWLSGKIYLAAAAGSLHKMKLGSSCPTPSTGVFPSSEDLGPEPASCSGGGPGLQGKKEKHRPLASESPPPPTSLGLCFQLLALEPILS